MEPTTATRGEGSRRSMLLVFVAGACVRAAWWALGPSAIESEGSYYARVGENLAAGRGYVGIREAGLQILYPPFYAGTIALGVRAGLTSETAGRLVSFVAGIAFPLLAFAVARRLYGARAGVAAGWLAAVHPLLIALSAAVLTEQTYLTLTLAAVWLTLRAIDEGRRRHAAAAGLFCAFAYLTRPEGLFFGAICLALVLVARLARRPSPAVSRPRRAAPALAFAVPFACVALAYAVPLSRHVGEPRYEVKMSEAVAFERRHSAGEPMSEVYFSIDSRLRDTGLSNASNLWMAQETHATMGERLRLHLRTTLRNFPHLVFALVARRSFGNPFLSILALLGLLSLPWTRPRLVREGPLLVLAALNLTTFGLWPYVHERFIFPLLAPASVWAGAGLASLPGRLRALRSSAPARDTGRALAAVAPVVVALLVVEAASGVRRADEVSDGWSPGIVEARRLGAWLRARVGARARVADSAPNVAYYAGAVLQPLPWTDSATAVRYLDSRRPDAVVLRRSTAAELPFAKAWFEQGIPEGRGELLGIFEMDHDEARVFRWRSPDERMGVAEMQGADR